MINKIKNIIGKNQISTQKVNEFMVLIILFTIANIAFIQLYFGQYDFIEGGVLILSLLFCLFTLPIVFIKLIRNYPILLVENQFVYYKNIFQSYKFDLNNTKIYLERKYLLDFLVITDYSKTIHININEIDEDFYNKLLTVKNKTRR